MDPRSAAVEHVAALEAVSFSRGLAFSPSGPTMLPHFNYACYPASTGQCENQAIQLFLSRDLGLIVRENQKQKRNMWMKRKKKLRLPKKSTSWYQHKNCFNFDDSQTRRDAGLVRSGRLFGGLINDIKRKKPHYLSDFRWQNVFLKRS